MNITNNYDHDCPFEAFITNLGKYNEGELVGEWVKFPTTYDEIQNVFERIGIDGECYEEFFITDYDCHVDDMYIRLGEHESLDELNYLASLIENMDQWDFERFEGAIAYGEYTSNVQDFINLALNLDCYEVMPDVQDEENLGRYWVEDSGCYDSSTLGTFSNYIDYGAFGRDVANDEGGDFTDKGYVVNGRDDFIEHYNGKIETIPDEYLVMSKPKCEEISLEPLSIQPKERSAGFER